jgi:hypothetical protein
MMTATVIPTLTEEMIFRAFEWFDETLQLEPKLGAGSFVLIEIMQKVRSHSTGEELSNAIQDAFQHVDRTETGWPRPKGRHVLQLGTGALNKNCTPEVHNLATKCLKDGAEKVCDKYSAGDCLPRDYEEFHSPVEVCCMSREIQPNDY